MSRAPGQVILLPLYIYIYTKVFEKCLIIQSLYAQCYIKSLEYYLPN